MNLHTVMFIALTITSGVVGADVSSAESDGSAPAPRALESLVHRIDVLEFEMNADYEPLMIDLEAPEAFIFLRRNYARHKAFLDGAARLAALGVVVFRVCDLWMRRYGVTRAELLPFVDVTVHISNCEVAAEYVEYVRF